MEKSKVYFTDMHVGQETLTQKLRMLMKKAGFESIAFDRQFTAVKLHFGEPGNLAYLRPNWARAVCDYIKELGGIPFLTDCNTLYPGRRKNALEHLEAAYENGYSPFQTGCHVIIGDGLRGTDEALVPVPGGEYVREAKIGQAVMDADIFISLTHFKGHEATGFGGALKNIGMGCGSRAGKMEMHASGKPQADPKLCIGCGACVRNCANNGVSVIDGKAVVNPDTCLGCGHCIGHCPTDAMRPTGSHSNDLLCRKIAEYTAAVLHGRPSFHIALAIDISPFCDCFNTNDIPIAPDVGMFASFDPVALDCACADAVNATPPVPGSLLDKADRCHHDHFTDTFPDTNWRVTMEHAQKLGIGTMDYQLIRV